MTRCGLLEPTKKIGHPHLLQPNPQTNLHVLVFPEQNVAAIRVLTDFHGRVSESASGTIIAGQVSDNRLVRWQKIAFELKIAAGSKQSQMIQLT